MILGKLQVLRFDCLKFMILEYFNFHPFTIKFPGNAATSHLLGHFTVNHLIVVAAKFCNSKIGHIGVVLF